MPPASTPPFALSTVALRQGTLRHAIEQARDLGFTTIDIVGLRGLAEHVPPNATRADLESIANDVKASGLAVTSVNADPGSFDGADSAEDVLDRVERLAWFCSLISAPVLVLPAGEKRADFATAAANIAAIAFGLNTAAGIAAQHGVTVAVEAPYFGRPVFSRARTRALVDLLDPGVAIAFDVSHAHAASDSVIDSYEDHRERVRVVHLRDARIGDIRRVIGAGEIDFGAFFDVLARSGFNGPLILELETLDSPYATKTQEIEAAVRALSPLVGEMAA